LTGASIDSNFKFYDETKDYVVDDKVFWQLKTYKAINLITGTTEGDLTSAPDSSADWKEIEFVMYNVYPSTIQTFTTTRIDILLDTERTTSDSFSLNATTGEVTCSEDGNYVVLLSASNQINGSSTSRSGSNVYLQVDKGSGYVDVSNFKIGLYHRQDNADEDTGADFIVLALTSGDKLKAQTVRYTGSATIETDNYNLVIVNVGGRGSEGEQGIQGIQGVTGADGDVTWEGVWSATFNGGSGYSQNMSVQYQGSSFVCTTNGNTNNPGTPASPNAGWDLLSEKGADGSGATITIQDSGTNATNTPHGTLNFTGDIIVTDAGSGVANIDVTIPKPISVRYGKSNTQTPTATEAVVTLDTNLKTHTDFTRSGGRITANRAIKVWVDYSVHMQLDSGDTTRNTIVTYLKLNGIVVNYSHGATYTRGYSYDRQGVANASGIYMNLANGDYIEIFVIRDDDLQSPVIGNAKTWISIREEL